MLEQLIKRRYYLEKHLNAPLVEERIKYIQYWAECGRSQHTLKTIAHYLLRVVELLPLKSCRIVTHKEIEKAAQIWGGYQYNHPQKRTAFSKSAKERFTWYATGWLGSLNLLEPFPEERIPLFNKIFERRNALRRHTSAPLLEERLVYLQYWADNGAKESSLRKIAQYLLIAMDYLDFYKLRSVSPNEIRKAADRWASNEKVLLRKNSYSKVSKQRFIRDATGWFNMLGCLEELPKKLIPFEEYLAQYIRYMSEEQGLSQNTVKARTCQLQDFLFNISEKTQTFSKLTPLHIEEVLVKKYQVNGYSRRTVQTYASVIRQFLMYAESQGWCQANIGSSVKAPRVYRHESLPYSPSWDDVRLMLSNIKSSDPTAIRDYAILILLAIYGLRCSEVTHLKLEDLDWKNELLHLRRAKSSKPQTFPLSKPAGEAIVNYLQKVRPNNCRLREVFLCMRAPYRPLQNAAVYRIVSKRLKAVNIKIKHYGPHALRHACATHLINEGISLKEISDHLGHQGLETTRIYAKVDLANLRKVAEFELGDLL